MGVAAFIAHSCAGQDVNNGNVGALCFVRWVCAYKSDQAQIQTSWTFEFLFKLVSLKPEQSKSLFLCTLSAINMPRPKPQKPQDN